MAYNYWDGSANPAESTDGPEASAAWVELRKNVKEVSDQRRTHGGCAFQKRLCSIWPTVQGYFYTYIHEACDTVTLMLRITSVERTLNAIQPINPVQAISLQATCISLDGRYDAPPKLKSDWQSQLQTTDYTHPIAQTVSLTAKTNGRRGWTGVLLWVWSDYVLEAQGEIQEYAARQSLVIKWLSPEPLSFPNPPERALRIQPFVHSDSKDGGNDSPGDWHQIMYWEKTETIVGSTVSIGNAGPIATHIMPPYFDALTGYSGGKDTVTSYLLGVAVCTGAAVVNNPTFKTPAEELFYANRPMSWMTGQQLVSAVNRLTNNRVHLAAIHPGKLLWRQLLLEATQQTQLSALVKHPAPAADRNGYMSIQTLYLSRYGDDLGQAQNEVQLFGKMRQAQPVTNALVGTEGSETLQVAKAFPNWSGYGIGYTAIGHNYWGVNAFGDGWQGKGWLVGKEPEWAQAMVDGTDFQRLTHVLAEIGDQAGAAYSSVLQARVRTNGTRVSARLIAGGISARELVWL